MNRAALAAVFSLATSSVDAQIVQTVVNNGSSQSRYDLVILGDGYQASQQAIFNANVITFLTALFQMQPYSTFSTYYNVHTVFRASVDSGVDHPEFTPPVYRNTAYDATYDWAGVDRCIYVQNQSLALADAALAPANEGRVIVLVNDPTYGGCASAGGFAVGYNGTFLGDVMVHEIGHSVSNLADEYDYGSSTPTYSGPEPSQANVTTSSIGAKWSPWIGTDGIAAFQGAMTYMYGLYRPRSTCLMRDLGQPNCGVCKEQITKVLNAAVESITSQSPTAAQVTVVFPASQAFSISHVVPAGNNSLVTWKLDGVPIAGANTTAYLLQSTAVSIGQHTLEVSVRDQTTLVRSDPANAMTETRTWQVLVDAPSCTAQWLPGFGGVDGTEIRALMVWDPDGPGPATPKLVAGGDFTAAGSVLANRIAMWDPTTLAWEPLGPGMNGPVVALAALPNGDLVAGGAFSKAGGNDANNIARWSGGQWLPLGSGVNSDVYALTVRPGGELIAGGHFTVAGGVGANRVARWILGTWLPMGAGLSSEVRSLLTMPNGDVIAGGQFTSSGPTNVSGVARWSGASWVPLGSYGTNDAVYSMAVLPSGNLAIGGYFTSVDGVAASRVAQWNGAAWSDIGGGVNDYVRAMMVLPSGELIAGGGFSSAGGIGTGAVAKWSGSWSPLGAVPDLGPLSPVHALAALPTGGLVAAGGFQDIVGGFGLPRPVNRIAKYGPAGWDCMSPSPGAGIYALAKLPTGDVLMGGSSAAPGTYSYVARWDGAKVVSLSAGLPFGFGVESLLALPNGHVLAGGSMAEGLVRWDGLAWSGIGFGNGRVTALLRRFDGTVVAGGSFTLAGGVSANNIAAWDGTTWSTLGSGLDGTVRCLAEMPNGDLIAGGDFLTAGGVSVAHIARWNGVAWSGIGGATDVVRALFVLENGDLVVGGDFTVAGLVFANRVARWNGNSWSALGPGLPMPVNTLAQLPDGDVVAGGQLSGLMRWDGSTWSPMGGSASAIFALCLANGQLVAGGGFGTVGGLQAKGIARMTSTCPAVSEVSGGGCASSGGSNTLVAVTPPWVDATLRTAATGLPPTAIVLTVLGVSDVVPGVPLSLVFPQAPIGCDLRVSPDILGVLVTTTGSATTQYFLPNSPLLVGRIFFHQMIPIELDSLGAWTAVTATNSIRLTAGLF